ncbi:MAG: hypothetical protein H6697_10915 [Myxococcales bacterium]|nr:hypothetical protein [Myxococcales bacterium]
MAARNTARASAAGPLLLTLALVGGCQEATPTAEPGADRETSRDPGEFAVDAGDAGDVPTFSSPVPEGAPICDEVTLSCSTGAPRCYTEQKDTRVVRGDGLECHCSSDDGHFTVREDCVRHWKTETTDVIQGADESLGTGLLWPVETGYHWVAGYVPERGCWTEPKLFWAVDPEPALIVDAVGADMEVVLDSSVWGCYQHDGSDLESNWGNCSCVPHSTDLPRLRSQQRSRAVFELPEVHRPVLIGVYFSREPEDAEVRTWVTFPVQVARQSRQVGA